MKKIIFFFTFNTAASLSFSQLAVYKMIGKESANAKLGYGTFWYWDIPLHQSVNRSLMLELMDFAYFPQKDENINSVIGYLSIKAGYRYIFSEESKTGFYIEPSAGYCIVVNSEGPNGTSGSGLALAFEGGYSLEVGKRGNNLIFGLKYESDIAGTNLTVNALSLRFAYSFHLFGKRRRDND